MCQLQLHAANCGEEDHVLLFMCRYTKQINDAIFETNQGICKRLTLPPVGVRTANVKRVDGSVLPGTKNCAKAAVWPSSGWLTFRSTE